MKADIIQYMNREVDRKHEGLRDEQTRQTMCPIPFTFKILRPQKSIFLQQILIFHRVQGNKGSEPELMDICTPYLKQNALQYRA